MMGSSPGHSGVAPRGTRIVGLTGGIGSGKSTVARLLEAHGARVVDADRIAREVVEPGTPGLAAIRERFGDRVIRPDGCLDRPALAAVVFSDPEARKALEAITHPLIQARAEAAFARARAEGVPVVVYDAALIVELGLHHGLDALVVVRSDPEAQVRRVVERDRVDEEAVRRRLAAQLPQSAKEAVATWVVDNTGSLDETARQVEDLWRRLIHDEPAT